MALLVALAIVAVLLSDGDDDTPAGVAGTPTPTPAVAASRSPTATVTPTATPTPPPALSPTPTATATPVSGGSGSLFGLAIWDGRGWQFGPSPRGATYREGDVIPLLLRIDDARSGAAYPLTIRYDCEAFAFLTAYDRDQGREPTQASGGPGNAIPDASLSIPDDPGTPADDGEGGSLSLWGGTFTRLDGPLPPSACTGEKSLTVELTAASDTVFLMWAAEVSRGAAERAAPLRLAVQAPGVDDLVIEIDPESVRPAQP